MSPELNTEFNAVNSTPVDERPARCSTLLNEIITSAPPNIEDALAAYAVLITGGDVSSYGINPASDSLKLTSSRPLLGELITKLSSLPSLEQQISVAETIIRLIQPRVVQFEEQDASLKLVLTDALIKNEDYRQAAQTLEQINLNSSQRAFSDDEKADIWVRIARCYLEIDDPTLATSLISRAKNVMHNVRSHEIRVNYQTSQARVLDSQRQFLDASAAYHTISLEMLIDEDDRLQSLSAAIICAVLAPAGPLRSRLLSRLFKDERAEHVGEFSILEKIFLDRLLTSEEVAAFAAKLGPHHLAKTADGSTVLDRAVLEHNLLAASKLYRNIRVDGLGALLGVDGDKAEEYAAGMVEQGRLRGHIDQIDGVIFFDREHSAGVTNGIKSSESSSVELRRWDSAVRDLAEEVEKVTTMIQTQLPEFYAADMVY